MDFNNPSLRFSRVEDQLSCELNGEIAILGLGSKSYFGVTDVAATIWRGLESPISFDAIVSSVTTQFDVEAEQCRDDVAEFLGALAEGGLLEVADASK